MRPIRTFFNASLILLIFSPGLVAAQTPPTTPPTPATPPTSGAAIPTGTEPAPGTPGAICRVSSECQDGFTCPPAVTPGTPRRCVRPAEGGLCSDASGCTAGALCQGGRCVCPASGCAEPPSEDSQANSRMIEQVEGHITAPTLAVPIPGLAAFQNPTVEGSEGQRYLDIPFLAQYISAVYTYALGIIVTIATVMVVIGGVKWMLARGDSGKVSDAKETLSRAVIGVLLALGSYAILNLINPELVNLRALRIQLVERIETPGDLILADQGSTADDEAYSSASSPAFASAPEPTPTEGSFRARMYEACGNRQGMSLPTTEEKLSRLRNIVSAWAEIGARQGGAIYVNGGNSGCTGNHARPAFMQSLLPRLSGFQQPSCGAAQSCPGEWRSEYNRLVTQPARNAGMFCGDCATTIRSLYDCFQSGGSLGQTVMRLRPESCSRQVSSPNYVFKVQAGADGRISQSELLQAAQRLRFGDVLGWKKPGGAGHVFMYTGGANLGFEILEMGNGGTGDVSAAGGRRAWERIGSNFSGSGLRTHTSARGYLTHVSNNARGGTPIGCVWAWRPIPQ